MAYHHYLVPLLLLGVHLIHSASSSSSPTTPYVSDVCDWKGSSSIDSDRSVIPIYLRCSRGTVKWLYPKGGLRVVLKLGTSSRNFRGCIRVWNSGSNGTSVKIYIEGKRQLHQIYSPDDGKHPDLLRCFVSVNALMALFIETDPAAGGSPMHPEDHISLSYDLQPTTSHSPEVEMSECHPCSDEQILSLYCSADFVLAGKVTYYQHRPELEVTQFSVKPTFIHRFPVDSSYVADLNTTTTENSLEEVDQLAQVTLNRPLVCAAGATPRTEYLFLGTKRLGNYFISCAPRASDWRRIAKAALEAGTNQCHII